MWPLNKPLFYQLCRYGVVGVLATLVHFGIGYLMHEYQGWTPFWAHALGFVGGLITAYTGHYFFTFKDQRSHRSRFPRFVVSSLTALVLHQAGVYLLAHQLKLDYATQAAPILMVCVPLATFLLAKFWVFAPERHPGN